MKQNTAEAKKASIFRKPFFLWVSKAGIYWKVLLGNAFHFISYFFTDKKVTIINL